MRVEKEFISGSAILLYVTEKRTAPSPGQEMNVGIKACAGSEADTCEVIIVGYKGRATRIVIPPEIDGMPVTGIDRKAFLGNKDLMELTLPETVKEIGEWAFAMCSSLKQLVLPENASLGRGIVKDCEKLNLVEICGGGLGTDRQCMLAAAPNLLDAEYLFLPGEAQSDAWIHKWDARLTAFLKEDDEAGYTDLVLCGEEDLMASLPEYLAERRRKKANLCFLRILHPEGLEESMACFLREYIASHSKGCEVESAWQAVLSDHGDDKRYYDLMIEIGCINPENAWDMITDLRSEHAEMKAYLMRFREDHLTGGDFFDSLMI